ncbi:MAG: bifunctional 5,10-methylenetetrahydrofolate dehydrogenase/5,10-methenyltetrahydrofolate cyclohydrolase [Alphaproteobacteria bacterium]|nr:bifunctional 5,10-methylenetetrahydrofolate dehydrogenase/5,10-methenyltetrahydrofolate cyclohydrolase [Alphaproteobacteria bacterium]
MTAQLLDGKKLSEQIRKNLAEEIEKSNFEDLPVLAVIHVGDDEASKIYVKSKQKAAEEVGIGCEVINLADSIGENALLEVVHELNDNPHINGIIVQLPLPKHINELNILSAISPEKDVDGFSPYNTGLLSYNSPKAFISATPFGILQLLLSTDIDLTGKNVVIIGRSNIVGKPLAKLLINQNCTVTVTHSKTLNLQNITRQADIVIAACGKAKMVKADWVKQGTIVIDVGINRIDGKIYGDVDFEAVKEKASFITPVPGGVGPMTVAMLLVNTHKAFLQQQNSPHHHCHCGHHHGGDHTCRCHS